MQSLCNASHRRRAPHLHTQDLKIELATLVEHLKQANELNDSKDDQEVSEHISPWCSPLVTNPRGDFVRLQALLVTKQTEQDELNVRLEEVSGTVNELAQVQQDTADLV